MKNLKLTLGILLFVGVASMTSCKKKKLVKTQWYISEAIDLEDGSDITSDYTGEIWDYAKDGSYRENGDLKGTWEFTGKKEYLTITKLNGNNTDNFKILKLKSKEMWLEDLGKEELHLSKY